MKKRIIHVLNWDRYQARSDKELPWFKLWGRLFKSPWFVVMPDDEKFVTIAILDLARQFNNKLTEEMLFKKDLKGNYPYLKQIYGVFMDDLRLFNLCNYLSDNEFLSDNIVGLEGDKIRVDKTESDNTPKKFKKPTLEELKSYFSEKLSPTCGSPLAESEKFFNFYESKGWVVGKSPMKNWHSAVANWIGNMKPKTETYTKQQNRLISASKAIEMLHG